MKSTLTTLNLNRPVDTPADAELPARATPIEAVKQLVQVERKLVKDYFSVHTNTELFSLQAGSYLATGAAALASGLPVVGNVLNAVNAIADVATAIERMRAVRNHDPMSTKSDVIADWSAVAIDIAGIFFPPIQWPGQLAITTWDAHQTYKYLSQRPSPAPAESPAPTDPPPP